MASSSYAPFSAVFNASRPKPSLNLAAFLVSSLKFSAGVSNFANLNKKMPEHATRIYNKMIQNGIESSIHTFNMLMKSYFMARNYETGRAVWDEITKKGICPDNNSYTVLIRGLIGEGNSREACRYLEEMLDKGMKTPLIDYKKFAADFHKGGQPEIFEELAQRAKFSGKFAAAEIFAK